MSYDVNFPDDFAPEAPAQLQDGDIVQVSSQPGPDPTNITLAIELTDPVSWWKGIILIQSSGAYRTIADVADVRDQLQSGLLSPEDLADIASAQLVPGSTAGLYLSKAKLFGVHDNTYRIINAPTAFQPGMQYDFNWLKD